ncbi:MAG: TIM barrel protein [Planctomycetia bacterium]
MRSAVTVSLVEKARGGPFVFWDDLPGACKKAADLGYDAVEIFAPGPTAVDRAALRRTLDDLNLKVAAVGTGAGMVLHGLSLTNPDAGVRAQALAFLRSMIDFGADFQAPAILGSMQGRWGGGVDKDQAMEWLREALNVLGAHAAERGVPFLYEPLNRYETNLCNTAADGVALLDSLTTDSVFLLSDLFHMNIEEVDVAAALMSAGRRVGHVHFVDSNRRPAGAGHLDFAPIIAALRAIGYTGYLSAEALPHPDSDAAAAQTIHVFKKLVG